MAFCGVPAQELLDALLELDELLEEELEELDELDDDPPPTHA